MKTLTSALLIFTTLALTSQAGESWRSLNPQELRAWLGTGILADPGEALGEPDTAIQPGLGDALQFNGRADIIWIYRMDDGNQFQIRLARQALGPVDSFEVRGHSLWKMLPDGRRKYLWSQTVPIIKMPAYSRSVLLHSPSKNHLPPGDYQPEIKNTVGY